MIAIIAAVADNLVIGNNGDLPWHLPEDLKHFKDTTSGSTVIMGYNTYVSIYARLKKPLPNRTNIVIARPNTSLAEGFVLANDLQSAIQKAPKDRNIFIIGGSKIYTQSLQSSLVDELYITKVHLSPEGDAFFDDIDYSEWKLIEMQAAESSGIKYDFCHYKRRTV